MSRIVKIRLCFLYLMLVPIPLAAHEQGAQSRNVITVTGTAEVSAKPDLAYVDLGVMTEDISARKAMLVNSGTMKKLFQVLEQHQINTDNIQTSHFSVSAQHNYPAGGGVSKLKGYQAVNRVAITVRDLPKLGEILDSLVASGANQVSGIIFGVSDSSSLSDRGRKAAIADARRKAEVYAKAAGVQLGPVVTVIENISNRQHSPLLISALSESTSATPIAIGGIKLGVRVTVTYQINGS